MRGAFDKTIITIGTKLAKEAFQIHRVDDQGVYSTESKAKTSSPSYSLVLQWNNSFS